MHPFHRDWQTAFAVIEILEQHGYEAVVVGGAVRDLLLERAVHDVDVATSALPEQVKAIFSNTVDIGIAHGTILVVHELGHVEVTTFRTESVYSDHRRPDAVQFVRSLKEDLLRRDFTINAMAMRRNLSLVDYYDGQIDLLKKQIRAVGDASSRFQEDALRMLRAIRFSAQLEFTIEENTLQAIIQQASTIQHIAKERIKAEFDKLWMSNDVAQGLHYLIKSQLASYLQGNFHPEQWLHFRTTTSEVGWAYFLLVNREQWSSLSSYYRLSNKEKRFAKQVVEAYDVFVQQGWGEIDYFRFDRSVLETAYQFLQYTGESLRHVTLETILQSKNNLVIESKEQLAVSGFDFLQWSGRQRGPWLKEVLDALLLAVLTGQCANDRTKIKEWYVNDFNNERSHHESDV